MISLKDLDCAIFEDGIIASIIDRYEAKIAADWAAFDAAYPHVVTRPVTKDEAMAQWVSGVSSVKLENDWCKKNTKGLFRVFRRSGNQDMVFHFERQEDAALFKLFWC